MNRPCPLNDPNPNPTLNPAPNQAREVNGTCCLHDKRFLLGPHKRLHFLCRDLDELTAD